MNANPLLEWNLNLVGMGAAAAGVVALLVLVVRRPRGRRGEDRR